MVGDNAPSRDEAGSGIEPPVAPKVRRAFGLLERFAPALGARWAVELWCTPPAVEMSLRMPPGVPAGEPVEATWAGHRIAGESWVRVPRSISYTAGAAAVRTSASSSNRLSRRGTAYSPSTCPATTSPIREISRPAARRSSSAQKRFARSSAPTGGRTGSWRIPSAPRPLRLQWRGGCPPTALCSWRRWATSVCIWTSSPIDTGSGRAFERACIDVSTDGCGCRCSTQTSPKRLSPSTIRHRSFWCTIPTIRTARTRRARESSVIGQTRNW